MKRKGKRRRKRRNRERRRERKRRRRRKMKIGDDDLLVNVGDKIRMEKSRELDATRRSFRVHHVRMPNDGERVA